MSLSPLKFTKMHGLGNDFILIDAIQETIEIDPALIQQLSNRHTGIGFDQLLLLESSFSADFSCRFFNADGSEAEQCGNGARAAARYFHENEYTKENNFKIETKTTFLPVSIHDYSRIEIQLGVPQIRGEMHLTIDGTEYKMLPISMGNPHVILFVDSIDGSKWKKVGKKIATHTHFPEGTNVGFVEIVGDNHIRLRTYERGVGETLACGSNACAAVVAGISEKRLISPLTVQLPLGSLEIRWNGINEPIFMTGPAERVFEGVTTIDIPT